MSDPFEELNLEEETQSEQWTDKRASHGVVSLPRVIATGSVYTDDSAIEWLKSHGATTEWCAGVTLIKLPEEAHIERGAFGWQYTIGFTTQEDGDKTYVEVELSVDANETVLRFHSDAPAEVDTEVLSTAPIIPNFKRESGFCGVLPLTGR